MDDYLDEAQLRVKELKLSGWNGEDTHKVDDQAFMKWGTKGDPYEPRDTGWWVESEADGVGRRTGFERAGPEHALAQYLQMKAEGTWPE